MSTVVKKGSPTGVLQSPTMVGGTAWLVASAAHEDVTVRIRVYSDNTHGWSYDQTFTLVADDTPKRVGRWSGLDIVKVSVAIVNPDGSINTAYSGNGVVDLMLFPDRSFS